MAYGAELDANHPGFLDPAYRARRAEITALARQFRTGMALPTIKYTAGKEVVFFPAKFVFSLNFSSHMERL